jgi:hypothetical protein
MNPWMFLLFLLTMILFAVPVHSPSADSNSCIACHTDDAKLKALVKPPEIGGEGEG